MRTPGADFALAAGFLFAEGVIESKEQIVRISYCLDPAVDREQQYNIVNVWLLPGIGDNFVSLRSRTINSSCGICGMASLEHLEGLGCKPVQSKVRVSAAAIAGMPAQLIERQTVFHRTGGVHACGLFTSNGQLLQVYEDVGRHNAVDKLVGSLLLEGSLPASDYVLQVSGRVSFEIVQKAARAGIPIISAVSAPTSLAVAAANHFGITLLGFVREGSFNGYTHTERIVQ